MKIIKSLNSLRHFLLVSFLFFGEFAFSQEKGEKDKFGEYTENSGFKIAETDKGSMRIRIFSYIRYLNQLNLDTTYIDSFGDTSLITPRQDVMLNKVTVNFMGWLMNPKLRYLFYIWTNNTAQGQGAQVVVAGFLSYSFNKHFTFGGGVNSLPGVRSTEGNFPFWLTVDNRLMADEYFRPSYTMGFFAKGKITDKLDYNIMLGNNLSQLGVDAGQLDDKFNTVSMALNWYPTTGEFGLNNNFGDLENHQKIATRIGGHFTKSTETRQGQPNTDAFDNVQIRVSDGNVVFKPGLFADGTIVDDVVYNMASADAGVKYKGYSIDFEYYNRLVNNINGRGIDTLGVKELKDNGFQLQASGMVIDKTLQLYMGYSKIFGEYGNPSEIRGGLNWFPWKNYVIRCNLEYIQLTNSPVGGLSLPYVVGGNGGVFNANFMINF
jgi:hypothetical protein